jgi:hypothetical protein
MDWLAGRYRLVTRRQAFPLIEVAAFVMLILSVSFEIFSRDPRAGVLGDRANAWWRTRPPPPALRRSARA